MNILVFTFNLQSFAYSFSLNNTVDHCATAAPTPFTPTHILTQQNSYRKYVIQYTSLCAAHEFVAALKVSATTGITGLMTWAEYIVFTRHITLTALLLQTCTCIHKLNAYLQCIYIYSEAMHKIQLVVYYV